MDDKIADTFIRLIDDSATNGLPEMRVRFWRGSDRSTRYQLWGSVLKRSPTTKASRRQLRSVPASGLPTTINPEAQV